MVLLAVASAWHATSVANVTQTLDWPDDASTPAMIRGAWPKRTRRGEAAGRSHRRGLDFYPVARYYAGRMPAGTTAYAVEVVPGDGPLPEFVYTAERSTGRSPRSFAAIRDSPRRLWRTRPGDPDARGQIRSRVD